MTRTRPLALLLFPALAAAAPLAAQAVDEGRFTVSVDGREVGTEDFTITQSGSGAVAVTMKALLIFPESGWLRRGMARLVMGEPATRPSAGCSRSTPRCRYR